MENSQLAIGSALTPHTLGVLADSFERNHLLDQARSLRELQRSVEKAVTECFRPLFAQEGEGNFDSRFNRLALNFALIRIYLLSIFQRQELLGFYEQVFGNDLEPWVKRAREMDMAPALIAAVLRDYMRILRAFSNPGGVAPEIDNLTSEEAVDFANCFAAATRFDYGLTAVLLVLERAIPEPSDKDKFSMLAACWNALLEYGRAMAKVFIQESVQRVLQNLEASRINIAASRRGIQSIPTAQVEESARKAAFESSPRRAEMNWLDQNTDVLERLAGHWIVIEKDELVANDRDYQKAREAATQRGIKQPFIIFVPPKESGGFMGI